MIPLRLIIKNFLSYGPITQTIDFEPYHLICLSGKNGHGKSALLDAITWAVWGQARKVSGQAKADSQLVHLGQTQMFVIFDFIFNDQIYRIRREFLKESAKPISNLDFGIINKTTGIFSSLTTTAIRTTQEQIEETIGISYETFINTAFLRQGNSNEFSKRSAKERKEILGTILGLAHYDTLRTAALEKMRNYSEQLLVAKAKLAGSAQELVELETITKEEAVIAQKLAEYLQEEKKLTHQITDIDQQMQALQIEKTQSEVGAQQTSDIKRNYHELSEIVIKKIGAWRQHRKISHNPTLLQRLEYRYKELSQQTGEIQRKAIEYAQLTQKISASTSALQEFWHKLEQTHHLCLQAESAIVLKAERTLEQHEQTAKGLEQQLKAIAERREIILEEQTTCTQKIAARRAAQTNSNQPFYEKRKQKYHEWTTRAQQLKAQYDQLAHKIDFSQSDGTQSCPLCEQHLSASRRSFLDQKYLIQKNRLAYQLQRFKKILTVLKEKLVLHHEQLQAFKKEEQTLIEYETIFARNQLMLTEIEQATTKIELEITNSKEQALQAKAEKNNAQLKYGQLVDRLTDEKNNHPEIKRYTTELRNLQELSKKLNYDEQLHQQIIAEYQTTANAYQSALSSSHTTIQMHEQKKEIESNLKEIRTLKGKLRELAKLPTQIAELGKKLVGLQHKKQELEHSAQQTKKEISALHQAQGKIAHAQEQQRQIKKKIEAGEISQKEIAQEVEDYTLIAQALGKDGIQALLIEDAIPEIEHEANLLLGQLTDNQAHIMIDSLRDLKKGGTKETLDIKISDASGIRPYELFSGGEAFRIDFALRIAISKLLARRAGTPLQTLIIDEGFGSQDEEGLAHIMEAIHCIQDNFSKIIIVSHLHSMKEQFPVHFAVSKSAQGTTISVIQQG